MILSYVGMLISVLGSLLVSGRVLNYVGDYNYGLYSFVNSITSWLSVISSALTASFLRFTTLEAKNNDNNVGRTNAIYLKLLMYVGTFVLFLGLSLIFVCYVNHTCIGSYNWDDSKLMYTLFSLSILNIAITMPTSVVSLFINYKKKFIFARLLLIITTVINFIGHFLIAYFTKSIILISLFTILITFVNYLCNSYVCHKDLGMSYAKATLKDNKPLVKSIIIFSGILLFNSIVDQINANVDKTLLGIFAQPEDITKYQMGYQLALYLTTMSVSVSGVFAPTIHELVANNDEKALSDLFLKVSKIQILILCCVAFGFLSSGKDFILFWLGETRVDSYYVGVGLMLINLCPLTLNSSIEIQRAKNKHYFRAICYFALAIANVLLSILFLQLLKPEFSIYACLLGTFITCLFSHWISMNIYNKIAIHLPVGKYLLMLFEYILIGFGGFLVVFSLKNLYFYKISSYFLRFLVEGFSFVIVYFAFTALVNYKFVIKFIRRNKLKKRGSV